MVATVKFSQFAAVSLANVTNKIVGVSALAGGQNFYSDYPLTWTTANRPSTPGTAVLGYNTNLGQYEFWNGAAWVQLAAGGSGSVNVGGLNQLAYYASAGSSVSGLMSSASKVLTTTSGNAPQWSSNLPASLTVPTPNITGVTNGSNAAAGSVGEVISSTVLAGSAVNMPYNVTTDITFVDLTAGDWDVYSNVTFLNAASTMSNAQCWIKTSSATSADSALVAQVAANPVISYFAQLGLTIVPQRVNITGTTRYYLSGICLFTGGTVGASGTIFARRVR